MDTPDLAAKGSGQAGAAEAVLPDGEADAGGRDVLRQVEVVAVERMDGEDVAVGTVAGRGACAAVVVIAIVVAAVAGTGGQAVHSGVFREAAHVRREVDDVPVPEAGTGRGVGVVAGQGEAFGAGGWVGPVQFGRAIGAACAAVDLRQRQGVVVIEGGGGEGEGCCHGRLLGY